MKKTNVVTIRRRVRKGNVFVEKEEKAELISRNKSSAMVKLRNGDVIKRKIKDVVSLQKESDDE